MSYSTHRMAIRIESKMKDENEVEEFGQTVGSTFSLKHNMASDREIVCVCA
jgi:hypothetical protein